MGFWFPKKQIHKWVARFDNLIKFKLFGREMNQDFKIHQQLYYRFFTKVNGYFCPGNTSNDVCRNLHIGQIVNKELALNFMEK
jgi:hypothetical protein